MPFDRESYRQLKSLVGRNIHRIRAEKNLPLRRFAAAARISEKLLDRYEIGHCEISLYHLFKIAAALDIEAAELLEVF